MNEDIFIVCPNCGEQTDMEQIRCPKCGLSFFPIEEEAENLPAPKKRSSARQKPNFIIRFVEWLNSKFHLPSAFKNQENKLFENLLMKSRFDYERTERLIAYEQRRFPHYTREQAIKSAIERWERDNH